MPASRADILEMIRSQISSNIEAEVFPGKPEQNAPGLYPFPIQYSESASTHQAINNSAPERLESGYPIRCLMMAPPAGTVF